MTDERKKSSPALIAVAWLVVLLPLGWGFNFTLQNAVKLFTNTGAVAAPAATPAPAAK